MQISTLIYKMTFYLSFGIIFFAHACTSINNSKNIEDLSISDSTNDTTILSYKVNPKSQTLRFYLKNKKGAPYSNFENLKLELELEKKELIFAMNGGMYLKDQSPQGLYIENGLQITKIDTVQNAYGNFYMQPNGIFYITKNNIPFVSTTSNFIFCDSIKYATQSGPMLLIDDKIHPKFNKRSTSLHIRNGVGILPNGEVLFAKSKQEINFYDFATFF